MTSEALLIQFDYSVTEHSKEQINRIVANTKGFDYVEKHLINLHERLKGHLCFVGLSSSFDYFKIKNTAEEDNIRDYVTKIILEWSKKYKIDIEKVKGKETYYVLGYVG